MFCKSAQFCKNPRGKLLTKTVTYTHHLLSIREFREECPHKMQTRHKLGISASSLFQVTWNDCCQKCFSAGKQSRLSCWLSCQLRCKYSQLFRSVSGHADTTFGLFLHGRWLHQLPQVWWEVGGCWAVLVSVLCAGFQLGRVGNSQGRGEMLRKVLLCPQLLSLSLFSTAFFHLFPWNYNSKWIRYEPFAVIISFFFTLLQFTLSVSVRRKRDAVSVWNVDKETVPFALWVKRYYLAQCMGRR